MSQKTKLIIYYTALLVAVLTIMLSILGVSGTMISMKYDTAPNNPCISLANGANLCTQITLIEVAGVAGFVLFLVLFLFKNRLLGAKKSP